MVINEQNLLFREVLPGSKGYQLTADLIGNQLVLIESQGGGGSSGRQCSEGRDISEQLG